MMSFKKYFLYQLKTSLLLITVLSFICSIATIWGIQIYTPGWGPLHSEISLIAFVMLFLCFAIPFLEWREFKDKRCLDTALSLPIGRGKLFFAHYLIGAIKIIIPYSISIICLFLKFISISDRFSLKYLIALYFVSLLWGLATYSFITFIIIQANTIFDSFIFVGIYSFVFYVIFESLGKFIEIFDKVSSDLFFVFGQILLITDFYNDLIDNRKSFSNIHGSIAYVFWIILGIGAIFGSVYTFIKQRYERVGGISESWFGYKTLIPITITGFYLLDTSFYVWCVIGALLFYIIYRRSIRLKKSDLIVLGAFTLLGGIGVAFG